MSIKVDGEVETQNTDGVVRGTVERFPPSLFLRDTALTQADAAIRNFALDSRAANSGDVLAELHALMHRLHDEIGLRQTMRRKPTTAAEAFARKRGIARDLTHIFIGAARSLQIPARYVAGYLCADDDAAQDGGHAWAEAFVPDLGWVGFDPANGVCPTDAHVRVAVGLDSLGAAPVRGTRYGAADEKRSAVAIKVDQ